jgi:hypothetical protein
MSILYFSVAATLLALAGCSAPNPRVETRLNANAALTGDIPVDPLQWRVITSGVDPRNSTMFTLFGNDAAIQYSRISTARNYPGGAVLALVTWQQQEDSRWYGGKIPAQLKSVELVDARASDDGRLLNLYRAYEGSPLRETTRLKSQADGRPTYLFSLRAAVMP